MHCFLLELFDEVRYNPILISDHNTPSSKLAWLKSDYDCEYLNISAVLNFHQVHKSNSRCVKSGQNHSTAKVLSEESAGVWAKSRKGHRGTIPGDWEESKGRKKGTLIHHRMRFTLSKTIKCSCLKAVLHINKNTKTAESLPYLLFNCKLKKLLSCQLLLSRPETGKFLAALTAF